MNATRDRNRPRRVLLMALGIFMAAQLGFGLWLDHVAPLFRFTSLRLLVERLAGRATPVDMLVLGSSRLEGALVESEAARLGQPGLFKACVPAGDPTAQEAVAECLFALGARPRRVVVELSPEFFVRSNFCAGWNGLRLHRWADLPAHIVQIAVTNQLGRVATARLFPTYQYRELIWKEIADKTFPPKNPVQLPDSGGNHRIVNPSDSIPPQTPAQVASLAEGGRLVARSWLRDSRFDPVNVRALERLVATCREHGAEVWLVTPPLSAPHRGTFTPAIEARYQEILAATLCRHIDCRDWMADGWFLDSHHLGPEGGLAFTRRFSREGLLASAPGE